MSGKFRYTTGVTDLMHRLIRTMFPQGGELAIDATLGNGHDTDFLAGLFREVIAIDIQQSCIDKYQGPPNVRMYCMNHSKIEGFNAKPDIIVYNLGYLPGADKSITTQAGTTIESLHQALKMIRPGGIILIALYYGHDEGREAIAVLDFIKGIPTDQFGVMHHVFLNRGNTPPSLVMVERKRG